MPFTVIKSSDINVASGVAPLDVSGLLPSANLPVATDPRFAAIVTTKQTASYTAVAGDAGSMIEMESASALTLTLPSHWSVPYPDGTLIDTCQTGVGQATVAGATNVTVEGPAGLKTRAQFSPASCRKRPMNLLLPTTGLLDRRRAQDLALANGANCTAWPDTSGNGNPDATQATTANQPKMVTSAINGKAGLSFNGSTQFLSMSGACLAMAQNVTGISIFVVYTCSTTSSGTRYLYALSTGTTATSARVAVEHRSSSGFNALASRRLDADAGVFPAGSTTVVAGDNVLLSGVFNYTTGALTMFRDGTSAASGSSATGSTSNTVSLAGSIGSGPDGTTNLYLGTICEVMVYSTVDAATRAQISAYVQGYYGITNADANAGEWVVTGDTTP